MSMAAIAIISTVAIGASIYQGEQQKKIAKKQLLAQERSQQKAASKQITNDRLAQMEKKKANQKVSGSDRYLSQAAMSAQQGAGSSLLTGTRGAGQDNLLGNRSTLG